MRETDQSTFEVEGKALGVEGRAKFYRVMDFIAWMTLTLVCVQSWVLWQHLDDNKVWSRALVSAIREQSCMQRYDQSERIKHLSECQAEARIP